MKPQKLQAHEPIQIKKGQERIRVPMEGRPLFSARARGIDSRASANARMAYCSRVATWHNIKYRLKRSIRSITYGISVLGDGKAACDLSSSTTVDNTVVADEVADNADGVVKTALGLLNDL